MIDKYLMNLLKDNIKGVVWSRITTSLEDNSGVVYYEGGREPSVYDDDSRYPSYMIYIESSDILKAESIAQQTFNLLHKKSNFDVDVPIGNITKQYKVQTINAMEPIRVGIRDNGVAMYSVNIDVIMYPKK